MKPTELLVIILAGPGLVCAQDEPVFASERKQLKVFEQASEVAKESAGLDNELQPLDKLAQYYEAPDVKVEVPIGFPDQKQLDELQKGASVGIYSSPAYMELVNRLARKGSRGRSYGMNAYDVDEGEFIDCVAVGSRRAGFFASGVMLRGGVVLTAAHIWSSKESTPDRIWIGTVTRDAIQYQYRPNPTRKNPDRVPAVEAEGRELKISRILRHPDYEYYLDNAGHPLGNDLMLLEIAMEDRHKIKNHIELVSKSESQILQGGQYETVKLVGFGNNFEFDGALYGMGVKRSVATPFLWTPDLQTWKQLYRQDGDMEPREFAAASKMDRSDSCEGDSGGPVYIAEKSGSFRLVGIVSRGLTNTCGDGCIYSFVPFYEDWILGAKNSDSWITVKENGNRPP
jgi:hypothetical protein